MRRKSGEIIPIEASILVTALNLKSQQVTEFHGFQLAKEMRDREDARLLTAYGTLYKALDRMETAGLLSSRGEDPAISAAEGRPRRRLYKLTAEGATIAQRLEASSPSRGMLEPKVAPA